MTNVSATVLTQASRQWASRPNDERYTSLTDLNDAMWHARNISRGTVVSSRSIEVQPATNDGIKGIQIVGKAGVPYNPTNWGFGQLATLAGAPAGYLRNLPAPIAADALNYGLRFHRDVQDIGLLIRSNGERTMAAATGPNYGRVWNSDVTQALVDRFGNGIDGDWRVPGEFGQRIEVTKANTTLYGSDRDMFVFLADETNRITIPNRRNGKSGSLARGFFVWNSEVGSSTLGVAMFLFDYACSNRMVWGAEGFKEIKIRHTAGAPDKFIEQALPILTDMSASSAKPIEAVLQAAQEAKVSELDKFLANRRFTTSQVTGIRETFEAEEGRPLTTKHDDSATLWDITTGITAYAKSIAWQDDRVTMERRAGAILDLAASRV